MKSSAGSPRSLGSFLLLLILGFLVIGIFAIVSQVDKSQDPSTQAAGVETER